MAPHCEIRFDDNPQGVYHGGQTLTGSVELRLDKPKLVNGFRLVISGCAEVKWTVKSSQDRSVTYSGKEELLRAETFLIPEKDGNTEIPAGIHVYNFATPIPMHVPTSFEGKHGKIRYTVRAILDRPWKFDQTSTAAFTVLKPLNLNHHLVTLRERREETLTKTFRCWPCMSNPLHVVVRVPMTGFVPGQKIPITVELNNTSGVPVLGINSKLKRKVSYISQSPYQKTRVVDETIARECINVSNDESTEYDQELEIPSVVPNGHCSVLVIEYMVHVKILVSGCHTNPKISFPITVGTIPFTPSPTVVGQNVDKIGRINALPSPTAPESPGLNDILPPSYERAINGMAVNVNDDEPNAIGSQALIPRYPVNKNDNSVN